MAALRADQAAIFMRRCRHRNLTSPILISTRSASDSSQFAPSNFSKPLRSPPTQTSPAPAPTTNPSQESVWDRPLQVRAPWHHRPAKSVPLHPPTAKSTSFKWLKSLFGVGAKPSSASPASFHIHNNPYRARKPWPPDFAALHPKQQFHFEKTYRRRAKLKWARPNWHRWTKLVQNTLLITTVLYFVFLLEPSHGEGTPFDGFRVWFFGKMRRIAGLNDEMKDEAERLEAEAKEIGRVRKEKGVWGWLRERFPG